MLWVYETVAISIEQRTIIDIPTALCSLDTLILLWKSKKIIVMVIVLVAAVMGIVIYPFLYH
jgi:chromate transporter